MNTTEVLTTTVGYVGELLIVACLPRVETPRRLCQDSWGWGFPRLNKKASCLGFLPSTTSTQHITLESGRT